jgi:hypothetical protein
MGAPPRAPVAVRQLTTLFSGGFTFAIRFLRSAHFMPMIDVYAVGSCSINTVTRQLAKPSPLLTLLSRWPSPSS